MREFVWRAIARFVSRPRVASWLIERSKRTPYYPIMSRDGVELYMDRWWLFNAYSKDANDNPGPPRWSRLPSIRVHHILREDSDDHLHDHPWNARTIVLRHWYAEERPARTPFAEFANDARQKFLRRRGYTGRVLFGEYHRISAVPRETGVYTLWFTWRYRGTWGFNVDGVKVPYREYLGL